MEKYLKQRTLRIADSSLFSEHIGYCDEVLLDTDIELFEVVSYKSMDLIRNDDFYSYHKFTFTHGGLATLKTLKTIKEPEEKVITLLSHELKILELVGKHPNIVSAMGLCCPGDNFVGALFRYDTSIPLKCYTHLESITFSSFVHTFITRLCNGLSHIHSKEVLHNFLTEDNVLVCSNHIPVITNFSWACRMSSVNVLTCEQQKMFENSRHLPLQVKNGRKKVSPASDRFSFGLLLQKVINKRKFCNSSLSESVLNICNTCFRMDELINLQTLVDKYIPTNIGT